MKSFWLFVLAFALSLVSKANMAYMGPPPGPVSGQQTTPTVRVMHELLTADLRKLPAGKATVFANYKLWCSGGGAFHFLFVADFATEMVPEILIDGKPVTVRPDSLSLPYLGISSDSKEFRDSFAELIGYGLSGSNFHNQPIKSSLFRFTVILSPGMHELKVGYTCDPTGYESGNLRYTSFPYFLGNKNTRNLYDSIFMTVLLPDGVQYESNLNFKLTGTTLQTGNIAGFKENHIYVAIYRNVNSELAKGWSLFITSQILFWIICLYFSLLLIRKYRDRTGKTWISLLLVLPVSLMLGIVYYLGLQYYYNYFDSIYGIWLRGSWGRGYVFLVVPVVIFIATPIWLTFASLYHLMVYGKRWDITRWRRNIS